MKALIIGATGATGKDLVDILLEDSAYTEIITFVRTKSGKSHPKLSEMLTDFDNLQGISKYINGDILFSCLGTTLKAAGSKDQQWHIDYELPLEFAKLAHEKGVPRIVLLSAHGASATSKLFYSRIKGKLEESIEQIEFKQFVIFRPGLLVRKDTDRPFERIAENTLKLLNSLGLFKRFRPLPTKVLAEKMAKAPKVLSDGKYTVVLDEIFRF